MNFLEFAPNSQLLFRSSLVELHTENVLNSQIYARSVAKRVVRFGFTLPFVLTETVPPLTAWQPMK